MPRRIRSIGAAVPLWLIVNTPPLTSARPTVPGPSGVVVLASVAIVPADASTLVPLGTSPAPRSRVWSTGDLLRGCVVAGAPRPRASRGAMLIVLPASGPPTGAGSGAQSGSVPATTRLLVTGGPSAATTEMYGPVALSTA